jgi:conjugative relaxase-like TrwC/TraI family protein
VLPVLNFHVVHDGGSAYYVDGLVPGRPGGVAAGERPGQWLGEGAAALGLAGTVEGAAFVTVMSGQDPGTGRALRSLHGPSSVSGYDLTFCAPKSVSLLHALAPDEIATEVGAGHDAAVEQVAAYLASRAVGVVRRDGHDAPRRLVPSTGMVAGAFVHRTSRALDPHLHTHVVAANVAQGIDGRWSAVDSRRVVAHLQAGGAVYQAVLRSELSRRLGAAWEVGPTGLGDVLGVDPGLRRLFSQRSAAIDEYLATRGLVRGGDDPGPDRSRPQATAKQRARAFYATRPDKDRTRSLESLRSEWRSRADDFGYDLSDLGRVVGQDRRVQRQGGARIGLDPVRLIERLEALEPAGRHLARRDVVALVASSSVGGATVPAIESVADRLVADLPTWSDPSAPSPTAEPRWACGDVLRGARHHRHEMVAALDQPERHGPEAYPVDRSVSRLRAGRDPDRASIRREGRDRDRDRGRHPGLDR